MKFDSHRSCLLGRLFHIFCLVLLKNLHQSTAWTVSSVSNSHLMTSSLQLQYHLDKCGATRFCEVGETKFGRGLVATQDMIPGEIIVRIPLSKTIIVEESSKSLQPLCQDAWAGQLARQLFNELKMKSVGKHDKTLSFLYTEALPPPPSTPASGYWSQDSLRALGNLNFLQEIRDAMEWRRIQCEIYFSSYDGNPIEFTENRQLFLDALDLVSSRTIRCGSKYMLVPFIDLANHASRDQGGGFYELQKDSIGNDEIVLRAGDRGVSAGHEVFLDYGDRTNEEWLLYYGFLPDRNTNAETIKLPESNRKIIWADSYGSDEDLKRQCRDLLNAANTTLSEDRRFLNNIQAKKDGDPHLELALKYRIAGKTLLSAVGGIQTSSAFSSAFLDLEEEEPSLIAA